MNRELERKQKELEKILLKIKEIEAMDDKKDEDEEKQVKKIAKEFYPKIEQLEK